MMPVEPIIPEGSRRVVYAEHQSEYIPLPAAVDPEGVVLTEWQLTDEELDMLLCGGRIRLYVHTFGAPLQPVMIEATAPGIELEES